MEDRKSRRVESNGGVDHSSPGEMNDRERRHYLAEVLEHYDELGAERLREHDAGLWPGQATKILADHIWVTRLYEDAYGDEEERPWPGYGGHE